jgi:hypothetical protein
LLDFSEVPFIILQVEKPFTPFFTLGARVGNLRWMRVGMAFYPDSNTILGVDLIRGENWLHSVVIGVEKRIGKFRLRGGGIFYPEDFFKIIYNLTGGLGYSLNNKLQIDCKLGPRVSDGIRIGIKWQK